MKLATGHVWKGLVGLSLLTLAAGCTAKLDQASQAKLDSAISSTQAAANQATAAAQKAEAAARSASDAAARAEAAAQKAEAVFNKGLHK